MGRSVQDSIGIYMGNGDSSIFISLLFFEREKGEMIN
jgi:hypothetical protein